MRFHTITPLHHVELEANTLIQFGGGVVLAALPPWLLDRDQALFRRTLSEIDLEMLREARWAFCVQYEAEALNSPDPEWRRPGPRSIQDTKAEYCTWANFALWLSEPSPAYRFVEVHAPHFEGDDVPVPQYVGRHRSPLLCHPQDQDRRVRNEEATVAAHLHEAMLGVGRETALFTAFVAAWAGLQVNMEAVRYVLFWIALEALFGPNDGREMTFRLSQRIALFLGPDRASARELFGAIKSAYGYRSSTVHGRWAPDRNGLEKMGQLEGWVRAALMRVLQDERLREVFSSNARREAYLDAQLYE